MHYIRCKCNDPPALAPDEEAYPVSHPPPQHAKAPSCRFRFQSGTGGVREIKALREMSPAAFSVSIETGSTFFRFQLRLMYRLVDRTMNACRLFSTTQTTRVGLR